MTDRKASCRHPERSYYALGLCRACYEKGLRARSPKHAEAQRENCKRWVRLNPIKARRSKRATNRKRDQDPKNKEKKWAYTIKKKYGLSSEGYYKILDEQNGVCAICFREPKKRRLHVDHNHSTGKIRGLLCFRCNYGLSWLSGDPVKFRRAADYLEGRECVEK